jgi:hypothetical protein
MLYKAQPPFMKNNEGFGVLGDVQVSKDGKLECHICGKWYNFLGRHILSHGMATRKYKENYGLPLTKGLVSRDISKNMRKSAVGRIEKMKEKTEGRQYTHKRKSGSSSAYYRNKYAACELQVVHRYEVVKKIVGRDPFDSDLITHDLSLRQIIHDRFGSLNKFREKHGIQTRRPGSQKIVTNLDIIAAIRKFYSEKNRVPMSSEFDCGQVVSKTVVLKRFGSWKNALVNSGVI